MNCPETHRTSPSRRARVAGLAALMLGVLVGDPAWAGVFSVSPVRIFMTPRDRAVAITVTNEGDTDVVIQAEVNDWKQSPDGAEQLVPSEDLVLSPPILKIAPKSRQVVRLARLTPPDANAQLTYRIILREVPEIQAAKDKTLQVPIALAMSMPIFITPPTARRDVTCTAARSDRTRVTVSCSNAGTAYGQFREIALRRGDQTLARMDGGMYVLPGSRKSLTLAASADIAAGEASLQVTFDDGKTQSFAVTLP